MAAVMIGVDPHKGSHAAVAIGAAEEPLGELRVRASAAQAGRLVAWAAGWPERTWAVEGARVLGSLLAQQLVAAGERVLDVQPKLGARVRLLAAGDTSKNDPDDARPVAIAALRSSSRREVKPDDHAAVLKVWSKRHRDLGRTRTQVACRLHAVLCELIPGGLSTGITAAHAARVLESVKPSDTIALARCELAAEFPDDLRRIDAQLHDTRKRLTPAVRAPGTTTTGIFGAGPVTSPSISQSGSGSHNRLPSARVNSCRWERSQRANASSMASASCLKVWLRKAAKIRPGRGQYRSPWPSIRSTRQRDTQLHANCTAMAAIEWQE